MKDTRHLERGVDVGVVRDEAGYLRQRAGRVGDDARLRGPHHQRRHRGRVPAL